MDLATAQRTLAALLRGGEPLAHDAQTSALAAELAAGNERLTPALQLDIYREQFFLRHLDVLRDDFASLAQLIGDEAFAALSKAYLQAFPPRSYTLRDLGSDLARFVSETPPWSGDPLLADLARIEWAFVEAFDAPDAPSLDRAAVAAIPEDRWPTMRIVLAPSVQLVALAHAAHDYRSAARAGGAAVERPPPEACWVVVYRGPERLHVLEVDAAGYALLGELARGVPLGEACERVADSLGERASFEARLAEQVDQLVPFAVRDRLVTGSDAGDLS